MNEENLEHALRIISTRRNSARTQQEERIQEIETRIPEVVEINRQLFRTSRNLLEIIRDGGNVSEQVESLRRQNQQGQAMIRTLLEQHGYPADYLELHYTCEKCQDTGFFQGKTCSCLTELVAKLSAEKLNQSVRFEQCSFENFSLDYYKGLHTENGGSCYNAMGRGPPSPSAGNTPGTLPRNLPASCCSERPVWERRIFPLPLPTRCCAGATASSMTRSLTFCARWSGNILAGQAVTMTPWSCCCPVTCSSWMTWGRSSTPSSISLPFIISSTPG